MHRPLQRAREAIVVAAAAGALLLVPSPAAAQDEPAPERSLSADEQARELYLRGDRLYAEGNYDGAVVAFEKAFVLSRRAALLYNMANALERLGRYEEALQRLNQYAPDAPEHQRNTVLKRIAALEARAEEQRQREARGDAAPATAGSRAVAPQPLVPVDSQPAGEVPWLGYAIGGVGVASIGLGVALGLSAASARDDVEARCVDNGERVLCPASVDGALDRQQNRALAADIAFALGAVAAGAGVYLVLSGAGESGSAGSESMAMLRAGPTPDGGKIDFVTTF